MIYIKYLSVISFFMAIVCEFASFLWIYHLYHASKSFQAPNHTLLKQILLRFTNCAKLNIQITNTSVFVKKYISNYTHFGLHYNTPEKIGVCFSLWGLVFTTYGILKYQDHYIHFALTSIFLSIIYVMFSKLLDINELQAETANLITDYIDNTISHRVDASMNPRRTADSPLPDNFSPDKNTSQKSLDGNTSVQTDSKISDIDSDDIIFSVINDFLV